MLNRLITGCASNFYHKSSSELQKSINALEQGVDTAEKSSTVIELLELLKEKNLCFMVERKTLISFFKKMQERAIVVENYKNGLSPQPTELNNLLALHRAKFYHTSDAALKQAIETLKHGFLPQLKKEDPTITTLSRALRQENGCNEISRGVAIQFFEQISASASILDFGLIIQPPCPSRQFKKIY
ncbi:MAG: hypothetical protein GY821_07755 [Gammaproteobacteria bacterium]|nr:hypothetical protein [Gammaproteobacteria bacterium]